MSQYLYTTPLLFITIFCMLFLTATNQYISRDHKKGFFIAFLGEFFIIVFEIASIFLNGASTDFKPLHFLSNYLGFLLSPIMIVFFAASIGKFHRLKGPIIAIGVYFILFNILVSTKQLFFIDINNTYHRGNLFFLYMVSFFVAVTYLLYETLRYSQKGFLQHRIFACLLSVCFIVSCSIQSFNSAVYTTRIAVVFNLCIYYAYDVEFTNLFDRLTGVLNQGTYLRKIKKLKPQQTLVILDIDNFKDINDNYGHQLGDSCLCIVSQAVKSTFGNYGHCYRIGGDEFAVILRKESKVESLITRFERNFADKTKELSYQVNVSIGYAKYEINDSVESVVQCADFNMYNNKKAKKALKATLETTVKK